LDPKFLVGIAVAIVMGWFAFGIIFNLRRGDRMLKWIQVGLPRIGERTTFRWLGTSVAELVIAQAKKPFRRLEVLIFLAPRDVPWLWLFAAARGRRDTLILRGQLNAPPRVDLEFADPTTYTGRLAIGQVAARGWQRQECDGLELWAPQGYPDLARSTVTNLTRQRAALAPTTIRFAFRRDSPHLELHIPLPDPETRNAEEFFEALRNLARAVND
jgi:hypothetical protein